jgi:RNA polymerase sigma factor (sigma-70 family)
MLGSVDDADDVVQETMLRAWRARKRFEGRSSFKTWLYRIATNACLNVLSRSPRRVTTPDLVGPTDDPGTMPKWAPDLPWICVPSGPVRVIQAALSPRMILRRAVRRGRGESFQTREIVVPSESELDCRGALWRDALVVVERGTVELVGSHGTRKKFIAGDILWLQGLSLRLLRNPGPGAVVLSATSRRPHASHLPRS